MGSVVASANGDAIQAFEAAIARIIVVEYQKCEQSPDICLLYDQRNSCNFATMMRFREERLL